jgi:hypothetical protein
MGRIDPNPSADDDQAVTDTKKHFGHGLLTPSCCFCFEIRLTGFGRNAV